MKTTKRFVIMCIVISMALCGFSISVSAVDTSGYPYNDTYMPVCSLYPTSDNLPFGDNTSAVYFHKDNTNLYYWFFYDNSDAFVYNASGSVSEPVSGFYVRYDSYYTDYYLIHFYSVSRILEIVYNSQTDSFSRNYYGNIDTSGSVLDHSRYYYQFSRIIPKSGSFLLLSTESYHYCGRSLDYMIETDSNFAPSGEYLFTYYICSYPDSVSAAIDSINNGFSDTQTMLSNYYNNLSSNISLLYAQVQNLRNQVNTLTAKINSLQTDVSSAASANQSAVSSAAAENSSVVGQAASDIINAGDGSTINSDMSQVNGIVSKLNQWNSELGSFANGMDDSISGVANALDNGKRLFEGFVGAAPVALSALIAFALIWFVVRKIIGR